MTSRPGMGYALHPDSKPLIGPHGHDYTDLARCFDRFRGEDLVFVPNPGNVGDALINLGTYQLFRRLGMAPEIGTRSETYPDRVLVVGGGGGLVGAHPGTDAFLRRNHPVCRALILLPQTVRAYPDMIAAMDARCTLFARENPSHAYLLQHRTAAQVFLGHDMAFLLDDTAIADGAFDWGFVMDRKRRGPWARTMAKLFAARLSGPVLQALRTDAEATALVLPPRNFDLSRLFSTSGDMSEAACRSAIRLLRVAIRRYPAISTNRLHMAVLGAILGRQVIMRDNSYGKNSDIHDHSIKGRFPNVRFERDAP